MGQAAVKIEARGEWLSKTQIAKRCGIHVQTLTVRLDDLNYRPDEERSSAKNQVYWFDDEMEFAVKAAKDTLTAIKIRDTRAAAKLKEIKIAEAEGELVPMADIIELSQKLHSTVYKEMAVNQPKRLSSKLARCKTAAEVTKILKLDADKFLKRLREENN